jgi:hypothetical protein
VSTLGRAGLESLKPTIQERFTSTVEEFGFKHCSIPSNIATSTQLTERHSRTNWYVNEGKTAYFKIVEYDVGDLKLEIVAINKHDAVTELSNQLDEMIRQFSEMRMTGKED